jgi:hypothetical protein
MNAQFLVEQSIHAWIKAGIPPNIILEGFADAFKSPDSLIQANYEVYSSDRESVEESIRLTAKMVEALGWK